MKRKIAAVLTGIMMATTVLSACQGSGGGDAAKAANPDPAAAKTEADAGELEGEITFWQDRKSVV